MLVPISWDLIVVGIVPVWLCCPNCYECCQCRTLWLMCGACRSTCLAIQGLLHCLDLTLHSWVILIGHQLGLLLQVYIPGEYCIVHAQVGILWHTGQSSRGPYNNVGWHDLWIPGQGFQFLWAGVTSSEVLSWWLGICGCILGSFAWWL